MKKQHYQPEQYVLYNSGVGYYVGTLLSEQESFTNNIDHAQIYSHHHAARMAGVEVLDFFEELCYLEIKSTILRSKQ